MKSPSSAEWIKMLGGSGPVSLSSLVLRHTGSVEELFDSFAQLREDGLIEVVGDDEAVDKFIQDVKDLEKEGLGAEQLRKKLLGTLRDNPKSAKSAISLTRDGLYKSFR